ncbi:MAG: DUF2059 domain-containing protein [Pseudomonadota bacterium]
MISQMISKALVPAVVAGALLFGAAALAQEPSASHLQAARQAMTATKATSEFDNILINSSNKLKTELIAQNPDKSDLISNVVDEEAIALASRRGDLEAEAARLFTNSFSEEELVQIANFFKSDAGQKYLASTPILGRELGKAARVWANGINRDLGQKVSERLVAATKDTNN